VSPAAKQTWKQVGLHLAKHGTWGVIAAALLQTFGPSIALAVTDRITGMSAPPVNIEAITSNAVAKAVAQADEHLERRANAIEQQLGAMVKEQTRMADKQALMSERMGEMVGELRRIK